MEAFFLPLTKFLSVIVVLLQRNIYTPDLKDYLFMKKVALITGVTGQDGAYLSEFLLKKGYVVHGLKRRSSLFNTDRIDHLYQDPHEKNIRLKLHYGDLSDSMNLTRIIQEVQPDEIYNLAAMSHVQVSFDMPEYEGVEGKLPYDAPRRVKRIRALLKKNGPFSGFQVRQLVRLHHATRQIHLRCAPHFQSPCL